MTAHVPPADLPDLDKTRIRALHEVARWQGPYWWRQASMRALESHGFVERYMHTEAVVPAWRVTGARSAYLLAIGPVT